MTHSIVDLGFERDYEAVVLPGLPGSGPPVHQFHRSDQSSHREGLVVAVHCQDDVRWIGNFQMGDGDRSGLFASPSPAKLCVVSGGLGYLVAARHPMAYGIVRLYPIQDVRAIPELGLILFASFTHIVAYGAEGQAWATPRVSWDGISISRVSKDGVEGRAWDSPRDREVGFVVNAHTGELTGGAAPPDD